MKTYLAYAIGKGLPGLAFFLITPVWLRTYGSQEYGVYAISWSLSLVISGFCVGWIRQSTLQFTGVDGHDHKIFPRWTMPGVYLIIGLSSFSLVMLLNSDPGNQSPLLTAIFSSALAITSAKYLVLQVIAQRDEKSVRYNLAESFRAGITILISLFALWDVHLSSANSLIFSLIVGNIAGIVTLTQINRREETKETSYEVLRKFWKYGWPMGLWLSLAALLVYSDRMLLGLLTTESQVGDYSALSDFIVRGFAMIAMPLTLMAHPKIMRFSNTGSNANAQMAISRNLKLLSFVGLLFILLIILSQNLVYDFLGVKKEFPLLLPILAAGAVLWQISLISHKPFEIQGKSKLLLGLLCISLVFSVSCNFLLIPKLGILGCSISFLLGAFLYVASVNIILKYSERKQN